MVTTACPPESDCDMYRREYAEMRAAAHRFILGGAVSSISSGDGKRVDYSQAKLGDMGRRLQFLKRMVDRCNGVPCGGDESARILTPDF